jgi:hypothetical protein
MPRLSHILLHLAVVLTLAGMLILSGCAATDGQAEADDVNNNAFTFPSGTVFHPALTGATTLEFSNNAFSFALFSAGGAVTGSNRFGSCILTVGSSTYTPGAGPQVNDVITLSRCDFDSTNRTLTVSNGSITATSNPAIARLVDATASDLNEKSFFFASGEVFNSALVNIPVTLEFTNDAFSFKLVSSSNTDNEATGTNVFGSCNLLVNKSTFRPGTGPLVNDLIILSTCQVNGATGALTVSNGTITITSI